MSVYARDALAESSDAVSRAIDRRRRAINAQWRALDTVVLVGSGDPIPIPGRADRVYPFMAHSEYFYLTDRQGAGAVLAYDPEEGWTDFVPIASAEERLWSGGVGENSGTPISKLVPWLQKRRGRRLAQLGVSRPDAPSDPLVAGELRARLDAVRRVKDEVELTRMRVAADATRAGFAAMVPHIRPDISERALQIEVETGFFRHGSDAVA